MPAGRRTVAAMAEFHVAQLNVARLHHPLDAEETAGKHADLGVVHEDGDHREAAEPVESGQVDEAGVAGPG